MKIISWNVNGLRACLKKGFIDSLSETRADIFCLQETKMQQGQAEIDFNELFSKNITSAGYPLPQELALGEGSNHQQAESISPASVETPDLMTMHGIGNGNLVINTPVKKTSGSDLDVLEYWNSADKKGYSGTAVFTKIHPTAAANGMDIDIHDHEGRIITLDFDKFYLVNVYVPNSQGELQRLDYRMRWEDDFRDFVCSLDKKKPVIICGDLNCAHHEIDLKNPKTNTRNAGFTIEERNKLTMLLEAGFTDTYRHFNPDKHDAYTWWSYMPGARERNVGWRIDYFLCSDRLTEKIRDVFILPGVYGSDHCPVGVEIDL